MNISPKTAYVIGLLMIGALSYALLEDVARCIIDGSPIWGAAYFAMYTLFASFASLFLIRLVKKLIWCRKSHAWVPHDAVENGPDAYIDCAHCFEDKDEYERRQRKAKNECWSCGVDLGV